MLVEFSKASLLQKARQKPEQVKIVLDMMRTNGVLPTLEAVFRKLEEPLPLGYCNAGVVLECGDDVSDLKPGDRVISNAPHAEVVSVPRNLCTQIPDSVSDEEAAFTVLGSIALQGIRLVKPELGESVVVVGLGLVGLLTAQLLRANGCRVLGTEMNPARLALARDMGIQTVDLKEGEDPVAAATEWTAGKGVDAVIITASAKTDDIVRQAAQSCRKRGRIVLVGVVGLDLKREDFYEKELSFQVSCSYGPGRYDDQYEQAGHDYPYGFVRWTEQRNFAAILESLRTGDLDVTKLITDRFAIADAAAAYQKVEQDGDALGVILKYTDAPDRSPTITLQESSPTPSSGQVVVGMIGAGNFAGTMLMPALAKTDAKIAYVASRGGVSAEQLAGKYKANKAVSDYHVILEDPEVDAVIIALQHHLHAKLICEAVKAGKHVFVEKPLCITEEELDNILAAHNPDLHLMVGFNRRFSPHVAAIRRAVTSRSGPLSMTMTVNAGSIPSTHWVQDPKRGGGRIIGEACHFIDLLQHIAGSPITTVSAVVATGGSTGTGDTMSINIVLKDGSIGNINYLANGAKDFPKESLKVFCEQRVFDLNNFRVTRGYGSKSFKPIRTLNQDKGHANCMRHFIEHISAGSSPAMSFAEIENVTRATFAAVLAAKEHRVVEL